MWRGDGVMRGRSENGESVCEMCVWKESGGSIYSLIPRLPLSIRKKRKNLSFFSPPSQIARIIRRRSGDKVNGCECEMEGV